MGATPDGASEFQTPLKRCTGKGLHVRECSPDTDLKMTDLMGLDIPKTPNYEDSDLDDEKSGAPEHSF
eukprot:5848013-Pyramimonas_sp.AAC.1